MASRLMTGAAAGALIRHLCEMEAAGEVRLSLHTSPPVAAQGGPVVDGAGYTRGGAGGATVFDRDGGGWAGVDAARHCPGDPPW